MLGGVVLPVSMIAGRAASAVLRKSKAVDGGGVLPRAVVAVRPAMFSQLGTSKTVLGGGVSPSTVVATGIAITDLATSMTAASGVTSPATVVAVRPTCVLSLKRQRRYFAGVMGWVGVVGRYWDTDRSCWC